MVVVVVSDCSARGRQSSHTAHAHTLLLLFPHPHPAHLRHLHFHSVLVCPCPTCHQSFPPPFPKCCQMFVTSRLLQRRKRGSRRRTKCKARIWKCTQNTASVLPPPPPLKHTHTHIYPRLFFPMRISTYMYHFFFFSFCTACHSKSGLKSNGCARNPSLLLLTSKAKRDEIFKKKMETNPLVLLSSNCGTPDGASGWVSRPSTAS